MHETCMDEPVKMPVGEGVPGVKVDEVELPIVYLTGPINSSHERELLEDLANKLCALIGRFCAITTVVDVEKSAQWSQFTARLAEGSCADVVLVCVNDEGLDVDAAVEAFAAAREGVDLILFSTDGTAEVGATPKVYSWFNDESIELSSLEEEEQVKELARIVLDRLGIDEQPDGDSGEKDDDTDVGATIDEDEDHNAAGDIDTVDEDDADKK